MLRVWKSQFLRAGGEVRCRNGVGLLTQDRPPALREDNLLVVVRSRHADLGRNHQCSQCKLEAQIQAEKQCVGLRWRLEIIFRHQSLLPASQGNLQRVFLINDPSSLSARYWQHCAPVMWHFQLQLRGRSWIWFCCALLDSGVCRSDSLKRQLFSCHCCKQLGRTLNTTVSWKVPFLTTWKEPRSWSTQKFLRGRVRWLLPPQRFRDWLWSEGLWHRRVCADNLFGVKTLIFRQAEDG